MTHVATGSVVRQLGALFAGGSAAGATDRQLLERYNAGGADPSGEAAFAALVARHGPMVMSVCRGLLGDAQHAEDAFQATFLVLARRARSIRDPDLLGNWLYGVAVRTAQCARQQIARRRRREEGHAMRRAAGLGLDLGGDVGIDASPSDPAGPTAPPADRPAIDREQAEAIHREVDRLPRAFRLPVVLCYFEGLTLDEAARGSAARPAPWAAGWPGRARSSAPGSPGAASCSRRPPWPRRSRPDPPRRPSHPSCVMPPPGPRSPSRPVIPSSPPASGPAVPPPRRWPGRF